MGLVIGKTWDYLGQKYAFGSVGEAMQAPSLLKSWQETPESSIHKARFERWFKSALSEATILQPVQPIQPIEPVAPALPGQRSEVQTPRAAGNPIYLLLIMAAGAAFFITR